MSSLQHLRGFISERLTAAAEEIFGVFEKTIVEFEEEVARQRKLLDLVCKPQIRLHQIELPQQPVCEQEEEEEEEEEEVLADRQLCNQKTTSSLDQEEPEPLQIKVEQEEICTNQEEEQLVLKQETDAFMLTPDFEEGDHREPGPDCDHQLLSHNSPVAEGQDQEGSEHGASGSARNESNFDSNTHSSEKSFKCDTCGKEFDRKCRLHLHMKVHTGEKPYACKTCGKRLKTCEGLLIHMRTHTGEEPFSCQVCGKRLRSRKGLLIHLRTHTGETPYLCSTCGNRFTDKSTLNRHMKGHTGEKPFPCETCARCFVSRALLKIHIRSHTGERPYSCGTCEKRFSQSSDLRRHVKTHARKSPKKNTTGLSDLQISQLMTATTSCSTSTVLS
ncbi:hypothetical protein F2P81_024523 [Scophthalmus maximus]|uniref:C2H2-type domain-containing protein n=1 Tax=Scophthalmus maximus TaxID=52904 RepID=A0A6A4RPN5_SCOMX|nr:hypothetical protein F2P81_024523 [Scophthalmus maximus]